MHCKACHFQSLKHLLHFQDGVNSWASPPLPSTVTLWQSCTPESTFDGWKQKKVTRAEVWGIRGVIHPLEVLVICSNLMVWGLSSCKRNVNALHLLHILGHLALMCSLKACKAQGKSQFHWWPSGSRWGPQSQRRVLPWPFWCSLGIGSCAICQI